MICDMNCLNCEFSDCILPDGNDKSYRATAWNKNNPEKRKAIQRRYYLKRKEKERAEQQKAEVIK